MPGLQGFNREEHQGKPGLHIKDARAVEAGAFNAAGHCRKRSQWINRIEVADQQDRFDVGGANEIELEAVAEMFGAVEARTATDEGELFGDESGYTVSGRLVVARGLDLDEFADGLEESVLAGLEIVETVFGSAGCFFDRHVLSA